MTGLPVISGAQCIRALKNIGYEKSHQKGSHVRLVCSGRAPVTVPLHDVLDRGTLSSILRTVNISPEQFQKILKI